MRRHCGRPGCNAVATATFSFDAARCVVWLNPIEDGMPRAGDLCTRHADGMAPPKGWERVDHRVAAPVNGPAVEVSAVVPPEVAIGSDDLLPEREPVKRKRKPAVKKRWHEVPNLFEEPATAVAAVATVVASQPPSEIPLAIASEMPAGVIEGGVIIAAEPTSWMPRYATDEDLGDVLDASTPLLSRAFNHARPSEDASAHGNENASEHASEDACGSTGINSVDLDHRPAPRPVD